MKQNFKSLIYNFWKGWKRANIQSNLLNLVDVSTAAVGIELTMRRLRDGRYMSTAMAETMRETES